MVSSFVNNEYLLFRGQDTRNFLPPLAMRALIAPNKFKGRLSAAQAADALARGWHEGF
jgi:hypothetical protein